MNQIYAYNAGPVSGVPTGIKKRNAIEVLSNVYAYNVSSDTAEANSSVTRITATAHSVLRGNLIEFTSGALSGLQFYVIETATNYFEVIPEMPSIPSNGDAFDVLFFKVPRVDLSGAVSITGISGLSVTANGFRFHDSAAVQINANSGAFVEVETAAAIASTVSKIHVTTTLGEPLAFRVAANAGAAAASTNGFNVNRGEGPLVLDFSMVAGDRLWVRSLTATAVTSGEVVLNFVG